MADGTTYRSLRKNVWKHWEFAVNTSGDYVIGMTLNRSELPDTLILAIQDQTIDIDLAGRNIEIYPHPIEVGAFSLPGGSRIRISVKPKNMAEQTCQSVMGIQLIRKNR